MDINRIAAKLKEKTFKKEAIPLPKDQSPIIAPEKFAIEIGCGVGMHPIQYALKNPQMNVVAIEHTSTRFQKFYQRYLNHQKPANLMPVHENALSWITHKVASNSVDAYFLLYPNPFPKAKDWNKRWFCMPFFSYLIETLKPGGEITLATNEQFYYEEARTINEVVWNLPVKAEKILTNANTARTHFEKKYLQRGQNCYNLTLTKS